MYVCILRIYIKWILGMYVKIYVFPDPFSLLCEILWREDAGKESEKAMKMVDACRLQIKVSPSYH